MCRAHLILAGGRRRTVWDRRGCRARTGAVLHGEGLVGALDLCGQRRVASMASGSNFERRVATLQRGDQDERMLWEFIDQPFTEGWMGVC